jgi:type II secretory ATPase GspE/PulE/Tfp pilus assembly ATPase PilB-like protein
MILVTGPTGSGKSTTLYASLSYVHKPAINIVTVEDPVEYRVPGLNQVQVNVKAGLTFASSLRSILRQDPDVIMVGEIRDKETAEISIKAAQTGHLVLSTLHTPHQRQRRRHYAFVGYWRARLPNRRRGHRYRRATPDPPAMFVSQEHSGNA